MNLYELASELKMNPDQLARWFKKSGMGNGKGKLTHKAVTSARLEFAQNEESSMRHVLTANREGLGAPLGSQPLIRRQVRAPDGPDLSVRPWLLRDPLDRIVPVFAGIEEETEQSRAG